MQIKRDYSQPFFSSRRRRRGTRLVFTFGMFMGAFLLFVYLQFDRLQLMALDAIGMAPTPTPFASTLASQGYELFLAGDVQGATEFFRRAVEQQPDNLDYLYEYGRLLIELADERQIGELYQQAVELGDRAIALNPEDPRGYALKAKALVRAGFPTEAIPVGVAGTEKDSFFAPLYAALSEAYTDIGRYQQGLENAEEAIRLDPMDADAHRSYAYALIWVGRRDEAIAQFEEAIRINPNRVAPYFEVALQYVGVQEYEMAIATYEHILSMDSQNPKAYLRMCETYSQVRDDPRAQGYCQDALDLNPEYAPAWRELGRVMYNRRNYEGAIEAFENCESYGSQDIECWYLRGLAHYYLNNCDEAWSLLSESLPMAQELAGNELVIANINEGLRLTTVSCPGYAGRPLPTPIPPPTPLPTPIGGF